MNKLKILLFILVTGVPFPLQSQDIDDLLDETASQEITYETAAFKATRIMNGHSIEHTHHGELSFRISHRFGKINDGLYELYGLDQATIHFSFEYGVTPWLMVGVGRSNYQKTYDGFAKIRLLRQSSEGKGFPVFVNYFTSFEANTLRSINDKPEFKHRFSYVHQLLVARKFSPAFSLQLSPTLVHRNLVPNDHYKSDLLSLGIGSRLKLTNRTSLNAEIFLTDHGDLPDNEPKLYHPLAIGFDIETGGHVFQLIFTNALPMREAGFIGQTTGDWFNGDIHFGFNISRVFNIVDHKK